MSSVLLDTHVLHWWSAEPSRVSHKAADAIEKSDELLVASVQAMSRRCCVYEPSYLLPVKSLAEPTVELLDIEWTAVYELCSGLPEREWELPTDYPGWTVKDQISHIIDTELMLSGEQPPGSSKQVELNNLTDSSTSSNIGIGRVGINSSRCSWCY